MAHIFKHPEAGNKGIIVFTHKEFRFFHYTERLSLVALIISPLKSIKKITHFFLYRRKIDRAIKAISQKYFIGIHWGYFSQNVDTPDWVDFHMAAEGTCDFLGEPFVIPLSSANFTPAVMRPSRAEKYWDILCVAKNDKKKNLDLLLDQIRKIYDCGYLYKVLFVVASNRNEPKKDFYRDLLNDYFEKFSAEERELFTILKTHPDTGFQGFSYKFLSHIYNQSKVFTIFSQREGECRVIKEAQLCGLPVVVKDDLEGGGLDYLTENNSLTFKDYPLAHKSLIEAVERYDEFNIDFKEMESSIGEVSSLDRLMACFDDLYRFNGQCFDNRLINTDNLNRRLPSHFFDDSIRWAAEKEYRFKTTDIVSWKMLLHFSRSLYL